MIIKLYSKSSYYKDPSMIEESDDKLLEEEMIHYDVQVSGHFHNLNDSPNEANGSFFSKKKQSDVS